MGPARADELRRDHFGVLRDAIEASDGREVKNTGDGLMVAFASSSGAARCAVRMQQLMEARNRYSDEQLHLRIGVGAGESTVEDGDYFGMPSIEAARLCAKAPSDGILASPMAQMMAGRQEGFEFESVGMLELKGIPDPVEAFAVGWEPAGEQEAVRRSVLPTVLRSVPQIAYVGRVEEHERLKAHIREVREHRRRMVFLSASRGSARRGWRRTPPSSSTTRGSPCAGARPRRTSAHPTGPGSRRSRITSSTHRKRCSPGTWSATAARSPASCAIR